MRRGRGRTARGIVGKQGWYTITNITSITNIKFSTFARLHSEVFENKLSLHQAPYPHPTHWTGGGG